MVVKGIISEFADEAAFLWFLRSRAVDEPHYSLDDLARLDERLDAQLDGLRVAGGGGWERCKESLGSSNPAECFVPGVLAFESGETERVQVMLDAVDNNYAKARVLISALGWLSYERACPELEKLLVSESPMHRYIGIAASAIHRHDPGHPLDKAVNDPDVLLMARGLRAHGELAREIKITSSRLRENLTDDDEGIRFSSAWSAALAGNDEAVAVLKDFVCTDSPYKDKALKTALRRMAPAAALSWQEQLAKSPQTIRCAVIGAGVIGDPVLVPWIIEKMKIPELARVAGEAFTMITGADIDQEELRSRRPEGFAAGPNDDPDDENVAMDADDNLPWPNSESIRLWWNEHKGTFQGGARYLLGKPIATEHLRHVLKTGCQRQRAAAALELALMQPGKPLFNVRAPGFRQRIEVEHI